MDTVARFTFQVRSYECGPDGLASLPTVCNYLQEAASLHAESLGFSKSDFAARGTNVSWVLTRLRVKMSRELRWKEVVSVETYPRAGRRITAERDFVLRVGDDTVGVATSEWMIIDLATRKVVAVPTFVSALANDVRPPVLGDDPFSKVRWACRETSGETPFRARRGDIDLNGHVNNVHYVEWLVEVLPPTAAPIGDFEIAFKSETLAGDEVRADAVEVEPSVWAAHVAAPDGRDHVVARLTRRPASASSGFGPAVSQRAFRTF